MCARRKLPNSTCPHFFYGQGLNRVTKVAFDFFGLQDLLAQANSQEQDRLVLAKSVVVIQEANHRSFSTNFSGIAGPFHGTNQSHLTR
jgi:hypothetical protein